MLRFLLFGLGVSRVCHLLLYYGMGDNISEFIWGRGKEPYG